MIKTINWINYISNTGKKIKNLSKTKKLKNLVKIKVNKAYQIKFLLFKAQIIFIY